MLQLIGNHWAFEVGIMVAIMSAMLRLDVIIVKPKTKGLRVGPKR